MRRFSTATNSAQPLLAGVDAARLLLSALGCLLATEASAFLAPGAGRFALQRTATARAVSARVAAPATAPRIGGGVSLAMSADEARKAKYEKVYLFFVVITLKPRAE